ncbi:MAG: hypothetical protein IV097_00490 [Burkholderiaceae bacterium]|nr:hypothetical protein [Burkholderiaceae bacterium]
MSTYTTPSSDPAVGCQETAADRVAQLLQNVRAMKEAALQQSPLAQLHAMPHNDRFYSKAYADLSALSDDLMRVTWGLSQQLDHIRRTITHPGDIVFNAQKLGADTGAIIHGLDLLAEMMTYRFACWTNEHILAQKIEDTREAD